MENYNHPLINIMNLNVSFIPNTDDELDNLFNNSPSENNPTSAEFIHNLRPIKIDDLTDNITCCICLESFKPGDIVIKLPCKEKPHYFHKDNISSDCGGITPWLQKNNTCPICRTEFPKEETNPNEETNPTEETNPNEEINPTEETNPNEEINPNNTDLHTLIEDLINTYEIELAIQRSIDDQ
jgi:hypothetical protein